MDFKPTASQQQAIVTVDQDLVVTAGAGSGKTRVLVERYLNLLRRGVRIEEIAAVTFTKKAAQEMKERLRKTRPELTESLERAQISTIHSLCQRVIQEHPLEAGIDPRFRVGEEWETAALLSQVIAEEAGNWVPLQGLGTLGELGELIQTLYTKMLARGDLNFRQRVEVRDDYRAELARLKEAVEAFLRVAPDTDVQKRVLKAWAEEWPLVQGSLLSQNEELELEALGILQGYLKKIRGNLAQKTAEIRAGIAAVKEGIAEKRGAEIVIQSGCLLERVHQSYQKRKRSWGVLDYNDLEHLAYHLLRNPRIQAHYAFKYVMVDEFQDTNPLQKKIVDCLVEGGANLFLVGDPKQSIYRFRGADLQVFLETEKDLEHQGKKVFLAENFRSRPEIIEFTNRFFQKLFKEGTLVYENSQFRREPAGKPSLNILRTPAPEMTLQEARPLEAQQIALKIRELVDGGFYQYQDISLLFRVMTNVPLYEQALQSAGIPYVNLSGRGFYSRQEIQDILNYFSWLEDEENEVARLAVLRSPFYLISDAGLYWITQGRPEQLSAGERQALQRSFADYAFLKRLAGEKYAPEVIRVLLDLTGYLQKTWRLPFGPQKVANVEKLLEQSWDLYARDLVSLPEQVRYLRLAAQEGEREGEKALDAEQADVVVLRTIHVAKGLEFPVVFLPDTNGRLLRGLKDPVLYHPDFGLVYKGIKDYENLKEQNIQEELSEAKRLLYVAVTRAQEEVFWCGLDGPWEKNSWWAWLQEALPEMPPHLYSEIKGDLKWPPSPRESAGEEQTLKLISQKPLPPQYNQVSFSVTALLDYARCPRCYYLRYVLRVPEEILGREVGGPVSHQGLSPLQRGNIVHRVCEQITAEGQLADLVDYAAHQEGVRLTPGEKRQLQRIIASYLKSEFFQRVTQPRPQGEVFREKEFARPLDKFLISGMIDQVFVGPAGLEIVDLKSNWIGKDQVLETGAFYQVQLRLYAWAMAREFGLAVKKSQAYFLIPNEVYSLPSAMLNASETEQGIIQSCREIIALVPRGWEAFPRGLGCLACEHPLWSGKSGEFGENTGKIRDLA